MKPEQMILYEDRDMLVCHKPSGLPVQSARVVMQDMTSILMNYLSGQQQGIPYLGVVHRLDQPVEGILVFAKNKKTAAELSRQVSDGRMKKIYLAVCCGCEGSLRQEDSTEGDSGEEEKTERHLTDYLKKDAGTNTSSIVPEHTAGAKRAELIYEILKEARVNGNRYELIKITLLTGRHHQIRVQMAGAGRPLYGDRKYNKGWEKSDLSREGQNGRNREGREAGLALCACELSFIHPGKKKRMYFQIKPSAEIFSMFGEYEFSDRFCHA